MTQGTSFSDSTPTEEPGQQTPGQFGTPRQEDAPTDGGTDKLSEEKIQEILKRDEHAQKHIQTLEQEARERKARLEELEQRYQQMEAELDKRDSFESALEKLRSEQQPSNPGQDQSQVDPDAVTEAVLKRLQQKEAAKQAEANKAKAIAAAKERYGEKFLDAVQERATALGMSLTDVDDLAASRPQVFSELFIGKAGKEPHKRPSVSGQAAPVPPSDASRELRETYRNNRKAFFSKETFDRLAESRK